jgi:hypothetical protein
MNGNPSDSLANVPVAKFIGVRSKVRESHQFQYGVLCCLLTKLLNTIDKYYLPQHSDTIEVPRDFTPN